MQACTGNMTEVLKNSENPKFRNCKFLKFLEKLQQGAYTVDNDVLVKHPEKIMEFKQQDQVRVENERLMEERKSLNQMNANEDIETIDTASYLPYPQYHPLQKGETDILQNKEHQWDMTGEEGEVLNEEMMQQMMEQWDKEGMDEKINQELMQNWGKAWEEQTSGDAFAKAKVDNDAIVFSENNPYLEKDGDILKIAKQLIEDGKI